jgi:hypothetical protein
VLRYLHKKRPADQDRVVLYWPSGFGLGTPRPIASIRTAWVNALRDAGLAGRYRFHDLRGVIGTYLADQGVAPLILQRWLGHADISTTMRYVALADSRQQEASRMADGYRGTADGLLRLETPALRPSTREEARKYVGVYPAGKTRFEARLVVTLRENGKSTKKAIYLGCYDDAAIAARAYDDEARKYPGRRLNFLDVESLPRAESHTETPTRRKALRKRSA